MKLEELQNSAKENQLNPFYIGFSDLMVLLCVFFVMILSVSKVQLGAFEKISTGFSGKTQGTLVELAKNLKKIADKQEGIIVTLDEDGVRLDLDTNILFDTGSAALKSQNLPLLRPVLLEVLKSKYTLDVEGHTDDVPFYRKLSSDEFESNWSLSGRRSASFIHFLTSLGFSKERLRIIGYGATKPKISLKNKKGDALEKARAMNRRVSILIR